MGWFWGSSEDRSHHNTSNNNRRNANDPKAQLDRSLQDFVEAQSPSEYKPITSTGSTSDPSYTEQVSGWEPQKWSETGVPPQSLYQDGRYSDLWHSYRPLTEIEASTMTDQDKLHDIVEGYKERKAQIGRAALENCSMEQTAVSDCFRHGGWKSRMQMCRTENKTFERCYVTQAKFLKALGYLSTYDRPPEVDEHIQMHADKLYQRLLAQEAAVDQARSEGNPIPTFEPVLPVLSESSHSSPTSLSTSITTSPQYSTLSSSSSSPPRSKEEVERDGILANLTPAIKAKLEERLNGLSAVDRDIEIKAFVAEVSANTQTVDRLIAHRQGQEEGIQRRAVKGQSTFSDYIIRWFRFT